MHTISLSFFFKVLLPFDSWLIDLAGTFKELELDVVMFDVDKLDVAEETDVDK